MPNKTTELHSLHSCATGSTGSFQHLQLKDNPGSCSASLSVVNRNKTASRPQDNSLLRRAAGAIDLGCCAGLFPFLLSLNRRECRPASTKDPHYPFPREDQYKEDIINGIVSHKVHNVVKTTSTLLVMEDKVDSTNIKT